MTRRPDPAGQERERIVVAMTELVVERGYEATTLEALLDRAAVSEADFSRHFDDLRACLLWTFRSEVERFNACTLGAVERGDGWLDGLRAMAYAAADFVAANPRFVPYASQAISLGGEIARAERDAVLQDYVDVVDAGRAELEDPTSVSRSAAEAVIGAIFATLRKSAAADPALDLRQLVPQFMYMAVRPYLGDEVARGELVKAPPAKRTF